MIGAGSLRRLTVPDMSQGMPARIVLALIAGWRDVIKVEPPGGLTGSA